ISNPTYSDGIVSISNASITVEGNDLLEKNSKYVLKVGLSRVDANGNFISKNTIELATTDVVTAERYSKNTITLTSTANYQIPVILEEGSYAIVVYAATEDEGIRVSEMKAIAFAETENDTIETVYYKIEITQNTDNTLTIISMPKSSITATIDYKDAYTYADIRRALMQKLLNIGFPTNDTQIQLEDNTVVSENDEITHGTTYKMKFKVETTAGVVDAYVYCTIPASKLYK
ncbi:MAG: hypothetical protein IJ415_02130, partial [Clostridia bacterium]|nr:hypothetical protein [Clostridia bacterium]